MINHTYSIGALLAAAVVSAGAPAPEPAKARPVETRTLRDGSTLTLLGETYGKEHDFTRDNPGRSLGPDIEVPPGFNVVSFTDTVEGLALWLRREGGEPGTQWAPWIVLADEHGCRFPGTRWHAHVQEGASVEHLVRGGSRGYGVGGNPRTLIVAKTLQHFPRSAPTFRVLVFDADGKPHQFHASSPHRPLPAAFEAEPLPAGRESQGVKVTLEALTAGLDWDEIRRSSDPALPPLESLPWHQKVVQEPEELTPWARVLLRVGGGPEMLRSWAPAGVIVEDRFGNALLYRPVYRSAVDPQGKLWIAFPSALCTREPAWKVAVLFDYAGPETVEGADVVWEHRDLPAPKRQQLSRIENGNLAREGITLSTRGVVGPGWSERGGAGPPYYVADLTVGAPAGEAIQPALQATDQDGRPVPARLHFRSLGEAGHRFQFVLEVPDSAQRLNLKYGVRRSRRLEFMVRPQAPAAPDRFDEAREPARLAREELLIRVDRRLQREKDADGVREVLRSLRESGIDLNEPWRRQGSTLLTQAIERGDLARVQALIAENVDVNAPSYGDVLPIQAVAMMGSTTGVEMARLLIRAGARVNGNAGSPPLMGAAINGYVEMVKLLLSAGADPNARDARGESVLKATKQWALRYEEPEKGRSGAAVVKLLEQAGAKE
ncbi:MAG: ankyrin repeat domain-containing protein [Armatimonadota bacterium]